MAYEVLLAARAAASLNSLAPGLRECVETHLGRLGQSPSSVSRPVVSPPYPPGGMVYEFDYDLEPATLHHFAVLFRYSSDESRLVVFGIGHTALDRTDLP
jgi:hypothetical protein